MEVCKYIGDKVLLVEGKNDCHVILSHCLYYNTPENFGIYQCDNYDGVLKRLNALVMMNDPPSIIGIVIDADYPNITDRWKSIKNKIKNHNYQLPEVPNGDGVIVDNPDKPKIGIWIMPNNSDPGMIEDFLINMIERPTYDYIDKTIIAAKSEKVANFKDVHKSKAIVHTYLAWQDEPGKPLGQAITAKILKPDTEISRQFNQWLIDLYK